jgi:hypothetical protein
MHRRASLFVSLFLPPNQTDRAGLRLDKLERRPGVEDEATRTQGAWHKAGGPGVPRVNGPESPEHLGGERAYPEIRGTQILPYFVEKV